MFPLLNTTIHVPVDDSQVSGGKVSRRSFIRKNKENKAVEPEKVQKIEEITTPENKATEGVQEKVEEKVTPPTDSTTQSSVQPLLMAEVVNITHEKFRQTEEIKVITKYIYLVIHKYIAK